MSKIKEAFTRTGKALKHIRILLFTLSQIVMVLYPLIGWLTATDEGTKAKKLFLLIIAGVLLVFNIIIEIIKEPKKKKQTKKVRKQVKKILKFVSNIATIVVLSVLYTSSEETKLLLPLTIALIVSITSGILLLIEYILKAIWGNLKADVSEQVDTTKGRIKGFFSRKKKQEEPDVISGPKEVKPTPVKKKIFPLHHETPVAEAPKPIIQETELSPKKRFSFPSIFKKRTEGLAEPVIEEVAETLPAPEVEEVEAPAPEKKKNPLLAFLPKKKGKVPEDMHTEEGVSEETLIK